MLEKQRHNSQQSQSPPLLANSDPLLQDEGRQSPLVPREGKKRIQFKPKSNPHAPKAMTKERGNKGKDDIHTRNKQEVWGKGQWK